MIHPLSDVQTNKIGKDTTIWQYVVILKGASIGANCNINCHVFIENQVVLGDNVTVKPGVYLWDGLSVEDNVFIGPNVTFTNDKFPRSKNKEFKLQKTHLKQGCSLGANSTILGGVTIGENSIIGAGSLVLKDVPPGEVWFGVPAKFIRQIEA